MTRIKSSTILLIMHHNGGLHLSLVNQTVEHHVALDGDGVAYSGRILYTANIKPGVPVLTHYCMLEVTPSVLKNGQQCPLVIGVGDDEGGQHAAHVFLNGLTPHGTPVL